MKILIGIISFFWFFRTLKYLVFYAYLWQLKEYHIRRFIDHFRTDKGKKLILNKLLFSKIFIFILFFISLNLFLFFLFLIYLFEFLKFIKDVKDRKIKLPVFTKKAIILVLFLILIQIIFILIAKEPFYLFLFDFFVPVISSIFILSLQPITFIVRKRILKKAERKRKEFKNLITIGITGSFGKTSVKEFLSTILSEKFKVLKTPDHKNSEMGISYTILNELNKEHEIFVCEMGAYNKGGINLLCNIADPQIGIITGVNEQHLSLFGSMENLISSEGGEELINYIKDDGEIIFNGDNKHSIRLYRKTQKPKKLCVPNVNSSVVEDMIKVDVWADNINMEEDSLSFKICFKDNSCINCKLNLFGVQNIQNILLAVCAARSLGMKLEEIKSGISKIKTSQGGISLIKKNDNFKIIDATYSANPDSVIALLSYLDTFSSKKVIVMPCLIELGKASKKVHRRIGEKIGEVCDLAIITTKDKFKEIKEEAIKGDIIKENVCFLDDPEKIKKRIENFCKDNCTVLLNGRISKDILKKIK